MARRVVIYSDELYHHGILGMKWGKKNGPPYPLDAEDHSASEKKAGWRKSLSSSGGQDARKRYRETKKAIKAERRESRKKLLASENKAMLNVEKKYKAWQSMSDKDTERERKLEEKYGKKWSENEAKYKGKLEKAKAAYKDQVAKQKKDSVEKYNKAFDKSEKMSNDADEAWKETKSMYKNLGKTSIGRVLRVMRNSNNKADKDVQRYISSWDKASAMSDKADESWKKTKDLYKQTGANAVSRILNNISARA